jgi:hypothetical protein
VEVAIYKPIYPQHASHTIQKISHPGKMAALNPDRI